MNSNKWWKNPEIIAEETKKIEDEKIRKEKEEKEEKLRKEV